VRPASTSSGSGRDLVECDEEERSAHLGDKVKRLESLLAKCKVSFHLRVSPHRPDQHLEGTDSDLDEIFPICLDSQETAKTKI
jgi:hypothetical protein